jgi:Ni,Fe-hydrogenase III small subunit/formate hydrogenlyase subunit 6/NADH:ubiquinone oxidoreductase subunit I
MFKILQSSFKAGLATTGYPAKSSIIPVEARGGPVFDWPYLRDARAAANACPAGAISFTDSGATRRVEMDYGKCIFCGECAAADQAVQMSGGFELAACARTDLVVSARYDLKPDGTHRSLISSDAVERTGAGLRSEVQRVLGRSLAIREVDAGSCNACELEIGALNNPVYDAERLGVHFVASPRHADMLLVTGPVTRNMELALRKTYAATPEPKLVVASGACAISGGLFGRNYATCGPVDSVLPVDVYIPGCPPRPEALLYGILLAVGRMGSRK